MPEASRNGTLPASSDALVSSCWYTTSPEHLADELCRLDVRISLAALRRCPAVFAAERPGSGSDEQALLAELGRLDRHIDLQRGNSVERGRFLGLPHLARLFRLSPVEEQLLLACFAPEADARYSRLYGDHEGNLAGRHPTVALLLELLGEDRETRTVARAALRAQSPLFHYRLLQLVEAEAGPSPELLSPLRIDPRIAAFLLEISGIDDRLVPYASLQIPRSQVAPLPGGARSSVDRMTAFVRHHLAAGDASAPVVFHLHGHDTATGRAVVHSVCRELSLDLLNVDMYKLAAAGPAASDLFWLVGREAVLQPAALCLDNFDIWVQDNDQTAAQRDAIFGALRHFSQLTFLLGRVAWQPGRLRKDLLYLPIELPLPDINARRSLWQDQAEARGIRSDLDYGQLASRYRFDAEEISDVLNIAAGMAYWRDPHSGTVTSDDISSACRAQAAPQAGFAAIRRIPRYTWNDLVLPPDHLRQLHELCNQATHRHIVLGEWGFDRRLALGNSLNVMFNGPSGTGKTMAVDVIANDLEVDLYKIDLSQIVSKYIGETEKNLDRVFREAQSSNAIVFFDEADALFGKRSEVKDAHDRYANIETGYLLQKMEEHDGLVILATNLRNNLDEAFLRRMHFVVEFPFPDEVHRSKLWQGLFPDEVPCGVDVDFSYLARHFKVPGGNIRNIAVCAAFLAAADRTEVGMRHLIHAARREYQKLGCPCTATDFGPYYELIKASHG
ncbi:MAG: AAA family ATPase [Candidatus Accumulibacter sp. UW20]|jgi:ATP-dependent 26S proteasome regulatory subunit